MPQPMLLPVLACVCLASSGLPGPKVCPKYFFFKTFLALVLGRAYFKGEFHLIWYFREGLLLFLCHLTTPLPVGVSC